MRRDRKEALWDHKVVWPDTVLYAHSLSSKTFHLTASYCNNVIKIRTAYMVLVLYTMCAMVNKYSMLSSGSSRSGQRSLRQDPATPRLLTCVDAAVALQLARFGKGLLTGVAFKHSGLLRA